MEIAPIPIYRTFESSEAMAAELGTSRYPDRPRIASERVCWTPAQDDQMMDLIADGKSFAKVGAVLGRTRAACVARFIKLCGRMGAQAA